MAVTIDELELDIQYKSSTASSGVEKLTSSLTSLRSAAKGGVGLTATINQLKNLNTAITSIKGLDKVRELVNGLNELQGVGKASGFTSVMNQLKKLPLVIKELDKADLGKFSGQITQLTLIMQPLATEMNKVSNGFSRLPNNIQRAINANAKLTTSNKKTAGSYGVMGTGIKRWIVQLGTAFHAAKRLSNVVSDWITKSNEYQENLNLFRVSMGEYYDEALRYANTVQDMLGIDASEWVRYQAVFQNMAEGFGIAADKAEIMSRNLTQMGYDLASVFNDDFDTAMEKLESALSGQPRPMREWGFDLSEASLKAVALSKGITKNVENMSQMEKAQLRYIYLYENMERLGLSGDFARTLEAPANALRVLASQAEIAKRELGNLFIPVLNKWLPVATAIVKVIRWVASEIASLLGFTMTEIDYSGLEKADLGLDLELDDVADAADEATDAVTNTIDTVKELKKGLMGFDELNILPAQKDDTDSGLPDTLKDLRDGLGDESLNLDLPDNTDWLDGALEQKSDALFAEYKAKIEPAITWIKDNFKTISTIAEGIGVAMIAWKVSTGVISFFNTLKGLQGGGSLIGSLGVITFISDLNKFIKYLEDFKTNGATFENVTGMISSFAGMVGDSMIVLGNYKLGGALTVVKGVGGFCIAIKDISENGVNWDNATAAIESLTNVVIGIGLFVGGAKGIAAAAVGFTIQGVTSIIGEIASNWKAIKEGDWSGVDKATLATGAIQAIIGIVKAIKLFKDTADTAKIGSDAARAVGSVTTATQPLDTSVGGLSPKLTSLAKNLGMGIVIIGEVAAAAALFVGAVIVIGKELEQVGIAWEPVIDNGKTIAVAMGYGTGILVVVGVATALLGSSGSSLIKNIGLGTLILAELGIATGLFLVEIWGIGKGLDEIGKAWKPVIDNGDTIEVGIGKGTMILVGIGAVAALLGVATVATAGLLPLAIGLGTALLAELGIATGLFLIEIKGVADGLEKIGKAWKPVLDNGDTISKGIDKGTTLLIGVGAVTAVLGAATVATVGLLPVAIGLGTAMLVELSDSFVEFTDSLTDVADSLSGDLAPSLDRLNGNLPSLSTDMSNFTDFMVDFAGEIVRYSGSSALANISSTIDKIIGWFTIDAIDKLSEDVDGVYGKAQKLNDKLELAIPELEDSIKLLGDYTELLSQIEEIAGEDFSIGDGLWVNIKEFGAKIITGLIEGIRSKITDFKTSGKDAIQGLKDGLNEKWTNLKTWWSGLSLSNLKIKLPHIEWSATGGIQATGAIKTVLDALSLPTSLPTINVEWYAQGGHPTPGQLFIANEAGAEMVGNLNGRNTVANNQDIAAGIEEAAYRGMARALSSGTSDGNSEREVPVVLDGEKVGNFFVSYHNAKVRQTGTSPLLV